MAVMNQKSRPPAALDSQFHQHHVEAKNLHLGDPGASLRFDLRLEPGPVGSRADGQDSRVLVKSARQSCKGERGLLQDLALLVKIFLQAFLESSSLDLELGSFSL